VALAKAVMRRFESFPPDPNVEITGLSELFRHPFFTQASAPERKRIMLASAEYVYKDELQYPWDNYFGRDLRPLLEGLNVLDLGSFTGGRAVAWAQRYRLGHITGIDTSPVFIDAAQAFAELNNVSATFAVGTGERLPFDDEEFDAILSFDVFEHVQDPAAVLAECRRVLKSGGRAFIVFPSFFQPIEHHLGLVTRIPFIHYVFPPRVLVAAYAAVLDERGEDAAWYARAPRELQSWERGHTINGLTVRQFRRLVAEAEMAVVTQIRTPLGGVGRRSQRSRSGRVVSEILRPLLLFPGAEEILLHRGIFVLQRP
jgi:SAM-dependent methyltransferase